jgi:hypothetical protein
VFENYWSFVPGSSFPLMRGGYGISNALLVLRATSKNLELEREAEILPFVMWISCDDNLGGAHHDVSEKSTLSIRFVISY